MFDAMKHILPLLFICALAACSGSGSVPGRGLERAEAALQALDYEEARRECVALGDSALMDRPSHLCRKALVYARLADACESPEDMDLAVKSYALAVAASPDSVRAFIDGLGPTDRSDIFLLQELQRAIAQPGDPAACVDSIMNTQYAN